MTDIPLLWPHKGRSDHLAHKRQEDGTCREAKNVVNLDPKTGRMRGGQRWGLSKYVGTQISAGARVRHIRQALTADNLTTYAKHTSTEEVNEWQHETPELGGDVKQLATDAYGNVYGADGATGVFKRNPTGKLIWSLDLAVDEVDHQIQAIEVGPDLSVFVAVSDGAYPKGARIWCYKPDPLNPEKVKELWSVQTDRWTVQMHWRLGRLYTLQNDSKANRSWVVIYDGVATSVPSKSKEVEVGYPASDFDLNSKGAIFATGEPNSSKGSHPSDPDAQAICVDWTPLDLDEAEKRIFQWYDAQNIDGEGNEGLTSGDEIHFWHDRSGNGRHLFRFPADSTSGSNTIADPPTFVEKSTAGLPAVRFKPDDTGKPQALQTNETTDSSDSGQTFPGYDGAAFAVVLAFRHKYGPPSSGLSDHEKRQEQRTIFAVENQEPTNDSWLVLAANAKSTTGGSPDNYGSAAGYDPGNLQPRLEVKSNGSGATTSLIADLNTATSLTIDQDPNVCIVSILIDGEQTSTIGHTSCWRFNGRPVDEFSSHDWRIYDGRLTLGWLPKDSFDHGGAQMDLLEFIVLRDYVPSGSSTQVITGHLNYPTTAFSGSNLSDLDLLEGYMAHRWGCAHLLNNTSTFYHPFYANAGAAGSHPNSYGCPPGPDHSTQWGPAPAWTMLAGTDQWLTKFGPSNHEIKWVASLSGTGSGVKVSDQIDEDTGEPIEADIYCLGPDKSSDTIRVRKVYDTGDAVSTSASSPDDCWTVTTGSDFDWSRPRMDSDPWGNVYIPIYETDLLTTVCQVYDREGTLLVSLAEAKFATGSEAYAVAIDPAIPAYGSDESTVQRARRIYVGTNRVSDNDPEALWAIELVKTTQSSGSTRAVTQLAVAGTAIKTFTDSAVSTPTGGSSAVDSAAIGVFSAVLDEKVFFAWGAKNYVYYDLIDGEVKAWEATSSGAVPPFFAQVWPWRGRAVLVGSKENPGLWAASKAGDPFGWNFVPANPTLDQAFYASLGSALAVPAKINTFVPWSDDLAFFGCDHHVYRLTGDPAAGGEIDLVSDELGMAWGYSWCKDRNGLVYFYGSNGGLFVMAPGGGPPTELSRDSVPREIGAVDLGANDVQLAYHPGQEAIHLVIVPRAAASSVHQHWVYELRTGAFWPVKYGEGVADYDRQPTCVGVLDADDPDDRAVVLGCDDSYIRKLDDAADDDDGALIDSYVTLGPYALDMPAAGVMLETVLRTPQVELADDQDGAFVEVIGTSLADRPTIGDASGDGLPETVELSGAGQKMWVGPGRSGRLPIGARGPYCWVRMRNAVDNSRWAFEGGSVFLRPGGRV